MLNPVKLEYRAILEQIKEEKVVSYARDLIQRESVNPPGRYGEVSAWVKSAMERIGLEVSTLEGEPGRTNVIGLLRGSGGGEALCLSAHTDVVGVGDPSRWKYPPFKGEVADGVLHGRGSADSKGMLAAILAAVEAIKNAGPSLRGDLYVTAPVDDETAGPAGLRYIFDSGAVKARNVVYGEATSFKIKHVYKSRLWFSITVRGKEAHGAFPDKGVNAIDKAYDIIAAVRSIELRQHPVVGPDTVSVGMIKGGDQVNKVCGECTVWFDVRWGPGRSAADIKDAVNSALQAAKSRDPLLEIHSWEVTEEREPLDFDHDKQLVAAAEWAGRELLGEEIGNDGGWYSSGDIFWLWKNGHIDAGIVWGPGSAVQAHAVDEHLPVKDLVDGAKLYALIALKVCA